MNWYILDTDKKHLRRRVDTNNHCGFSLGKVHHPSGLHAGSPPGRVLPSPHQCKTLPNPSTALYFTGKASSRGRTQHNMRPAARQGKLPQPLPSGVSFSGNTRPFGPAAGKARYKAAAGLGFVKTTSTKLGFKPRQQQGGPSLQKGRGAAAMAELRTLSNSAHCNLKNQIIIPLLVA